MTRHFGLKTVPHILAGICFLATQTSAYAFTAGSGEKDYFAKVAAVDDSTLETVRGGWTLSNGMTIDFSISTQTFVDGIIQQQIQHEFPWLLNNQEPTKQDSSWQSNNNQKESAGNVPPGVNTTPQYTPNVSNTPGIQTMQNPGGGGTTVTTTTPSELVTLIQIGPNNSAFQDGLPTTNTPFTVIQNTLDNKVIQNLNLLDITASNVSQFKSQALTNSLNHQLVMGLH